MRHKLISIISLVVLSIAPMAAEDGSRLWLRQGQGADAQVTVISSRQSPTLDIAVRDYNSHGVASQ